MCLYGQTAKKSHDEFLKAHMETDTGSNFGSEKLCRAQIFVDRKGFRDIIVCKTMYGYSLRWASGLQNFELISSYRARDFDGCWNKAYLAAFAAAMRWVDEDKERRWASICDPSH